MDKKQFLSISRKFFKEKGCQIIKNSRFIYQTEEFDVEFQMMHSNFGEYYYLSYYFYLHGMGSYYPTSDECASGRVSDLMSTPEIYYLDIEQDDFSKRLERVFDEELKPIMEQGLSYIMKLWKSQKLLLFAGTTKYMQSLEKEMSASKAEENGN